MAKRKTTRKRNGAISGRDSKGQYFAFEIDGKRSKLYRSRDERDRDYATAREFASELKSGARRSKVAYDSQAGAFRRVNPKKKKAKRTKAKASKRGAKSTGRRRGTKVPSIAKRKNPGKRRPAAAYVVIMTRAGERGNKSVQVQATTAGNASLAARKQAKGWKVLSVRRGNGSEVTAAAKMFKKFHGKPASGVREVTQLRNTPSVLADCGALVELIVDTGRGGRKLTFKSGVRVATTGDGGQLYFVGGDQAVNLDGWPGVKLPKDQVELGYCHSICYHTSKDFHDFVPSDYEHEFGEDGGEPPLLCYDVHSRRLYLVGGSYKVKRAGIIN